MQTTSLTSQTHFRKRGKGLVNCVYKPCPTGMQLAGWRNQISNNALLNYLLQSKHAPWKLSSKCFYGCCSSGKDVLVLFRCFQDCYCYSNNDVMCHVTKYCNTIGPHCTVWRDKACIHSSPDHFPLLRKWVWLARLAHNIHVQVDSMSIYIPVYGCTPVLVAHPLLFSQPRLRPPFENTSCLEQYFLVYQSLSYRGRDKGG